MKISLGFVEQDRSGGRARSRRKRRVTAAGHGSLGALANLGDYGNSFGQSPKTRPKWSQKLSFKITDARKQPVEYLWYVGDFASLDPRLQQIARTVAEVFHHAGMDFGILYDGEKNSGNDVRRVGEEGLFEVLVEENVATLQKAHFQKIATTDPRSPGDQRGAI